MALYYRGRHCMQLVDQRQGVVHASRQGGYNSSASEELIMLRYQVRDSGYGSVQREPLGYLGAEAIKED